MVITDENNKLISPKNMDHRGWYSTSGITSNSEELLLQSFVAPKEVTKGLCGYLKTKISDIIMSDYTIYFLNVRKILILFPTWGLHLCFSVFHFVLQSVAEQRLLGPPMVNKFQDPDIKTPTNAVGR